MTTPSSQSSDASLQDFGPRASFLQQLLDEIKGTSTPTILRTRGTLHHAPTSPASSHDSGRQASSVWIGGATIAQDARDKLRAADEARFCKVLTQAIDGTPDRHRPTPHMPTRRLYGRSSSCSRMVNWLSHSGSSTSDLLKEGCSAHGEYDVTTSSAEPSHLQPTVGGSRPPSKTLNIQPSWSGGDIAGADSPPVLYEIVYDISSTPSPTEAPTSAVSEASTEATVVPEDLPSAHSFRSNGPGKRARSPHVPPEMLTKKIRTMTLPAHQNRKLTRSDTTAFSSFGAIDGDTKGLVRASTFVERTPVSPESISPTDIHALPRLSSFRPEVATPPRTPVRRSVLEFPMLEQEDSPTPAQTPTFARSLHLVDTDISIYKHDHGDEYRENSLCLYCFRQHGSLNRIFTYGYEVCGREEVLTSHYWEAAPSYYT